ncbi:MAG: CDP-alcohol phosphatidyltransferase family protein [Myxococcota bacterium]
MAQHCVYRLQAAGIKKFVVVLGSDSKQVRCHFEEAIHQCNGQVRFVTVNEWQKGDGYCILQVQDVIDTSSCSSFLLASVDDLLSVELIQKIMHQSLCAHPVSVAVDNGQYAGLMRATSFLFSHIDPFGKQDLPDLAAALTTQQMHASTIDVTGLFWQHIHTPADLTKAQSHLLAHLNKEKQDGFFSQYIGRAISSKISMRLARMDLTPNQITWMGFILMLFAAIVLSLPSSSWQIFGAVIVVIACALDGCDGEVARLRCQQTSYGGWLDTMLDRYADLALALALTWSAFQRDPQALIWLVGCLSALGFVLTSYAKKEYHLRHNCPYPHTTMARLGQRDVRIALIVIGALVGFPFFAVMVAGLLSHGVVFWMLFAATRK